MGDSHSVLGQSSGLIGANGRGWTQGLDGFQVLDEAVLWGHALGGQGEADSDGGQETLRDVSDDDTDQEDDSVEPVVAEDESDDEEADSKEDSDGGDLSMTRKFIVYITLDRKIIWMKKL